MKRKRNADNLIFCNDDGLKKKRKAKDGKAIDYSKQSHCRHCGELFPSRNQLFYHLELNLSHMTDELSITDLIDGFENQMHIEVKT